jgi:hypothetical protein
MVNTIASTSANTVFATSTVVAAVVASGRK